MKILVVGAGFAGATVARELAEAGHQVLVIDARNHVAGNAHDFVNEHGIRVHRYGPHIWHTSNDEVQEWASRFTEWIPYEHRVEAQLADGSFVPLPINNRTLEHIFGEELEAWAIANHMRYGDRWDGFWIHDEAYPGFLDTLRVPHAEITNSRQHVENAVGKKLCDLFFAPYTKKMWGLELDELPASVAARIPTNVSAEALESRYFPKDKHQYLPKDGYTKMVQNILSHPNIDVRLCTRRKDLIQFGATYHYPYVVDRMWDNVTFDHVFTSEPIDTFFDCQLGELPWRSIKMHTYTVPVMKVLPTPVVNYTNDGPFTRITEWKRLPGHGDNPQWTTLTAEEPCDYRDNHMERYYPVKSSDVNDPNRALYRRYCEMADALPNVTFIGRCGTYQYLDMWMVIAQSLKIAKTFLKERA